MSQGNPKGKGGTVLMSNFNSPPGAPQQPPPGAPPGHHPEAPYGAPPGAPYGAPAGAPPAGYGPPPGAPYNAPPAGYGPPPGAPPGGGYGPPAGAPPQAWGAPQPGGMAPPPAGMAPYAPPGGAMAPYAGSQGSSGAVPDYVPGDKTQTLGLDQNLAAALGHIIGILAIVFAVSEPKNHRFVRFYSFQYIFFGIAASVLAVALSIVSFVLAKILPGALAMLAVAVFLPLLALAPIGLWSAWKAYQGKVWKIPVVGNMAEKFALKD